MVGHDLPIHGGDAQGGGAPGLCSRSKPSGRWRGQPMAGHTTDARLSGPMISVKSWWWPKRPARVPRAWTAGLLAALGAGLFGVAALLFRAGAVSWDVSLFRILNKVPPGAAAVLTPLSHLFLPAGIIAVVVLTVGYVVARNRSILPVATAVVAACTGWALAHVAKAIADRPRPYEAITGAVLRQQPAHGTSFPSSHTAVTLAVAIALVPFMARPLATVGITYAVLVGWSRVYLGVHYPLDVLGAAGIGMAVGGVILLALGLLLRAGPANTPNVAQSAGRLAQSPMISRKDSANDGRLLFSNWGTRQIAAFVEPKEGQRYGP